MDIQMAAMPKWLSGVVGGIIGGLICGLNVILILLLLDIVIGIFGSEALIWDGLGLPIGIYLGILIIIIGISLFVVQGMMKSPTNRLNLFKKMMLVGGLIAGAFFIVQEVLFNVLSLPPWAKAVIEVVLAVISAALMGWLMTKFLIDAKYKRVPTKMQKAMFWGAGGLGMVLGGISLIFTTLKEYSRVKYFS